MVQLILYSREDGQSQVLRRAERGTVWLTQLEMAELFSASKQNIYQDGELDPAATVKESLTVQTEGAFKAYCHAAFDHFRDVTKMLGRGSGSKCEVDHVSQFGPTSHQH